MTESKQEEDKTSLRSNESQLASKFEPTFSENILKLKHSFGYDCKRLYNMVLIDDNTLVFASGTYIHYFNIKEREVTYYESVFGCGIGFITKNYHPNYPKLLTIGENGPKATVFIYEFPSLAIRSKLEGAAKQQFTCGSYNYTGELFASQAGYPDYMLTIWNWEKAETILRSKAFQNDVLYIHFSQFNPILLVTCGLSHIKFWKMADTFTGLKLKGDLGRFGKTDFSDIYAAFMLGDENVISGCEWGNMLLWEAGLIKFEICRKGRKPCHTKPIVRITMENGEVTTVGMDGYVRIWFWETVDLADPPDDDRFVEIEPIYEFYVGECEIRMIQKIKLFDETDYGYYALDGNGGIWYCDLNTRDIPNDSYKLYSCHGGKVIAAQASPASPHLMTLGEDGRLLVYDYLFKKIILEKNFQSKGTDLIWFSPIISNSCMELVASFEDGVIRHIYLDLTQPSKPTIYLIQPIKAHTAAVTRMTINSFDTLLLTGSADRTVFIYNLTEKNEYFICLKPIGFIEFAAIPNCFYWKDPQHTIFIGCKSGEVYEYKLPTEVTEEQTFLSYNLTDQNEIKKITKFVSVKSLIRRELKRAATKKRKEKKKQRKLEEVEKLKAANPGLQIDMEQALADSEPEEEEEPLHIPAVPNPILWIRYTPNNTLWVSVGGYDAGYIYELSIGVSQVVRSTIITDGDDTEIHSCIDIEDYLIFGMINGKIRINSKNPHDFTDLRNYRLYNMHDPINGNIPRLIINYDGKILFSIGHDGNVFVYEWLGPRVSIKHRSAIFMPKKTIPAEDITDPKHPSLEQEKINAEIKRKEEAAFAHDRKVLMEIGALQKKFNALMSANEAMDKDLRIPHRELLLDERITNQIRDELQAELDDVREDLAYDLEVAQVGRQKLYNYFLKNLDHIPFNISAIWKNLTVYSFRVQRLDENFEAIKADIEERLRLEALKRVPVQLMMAEDKERSMPEPPVETFFFGRDPNTIIPRFSCKMLRLLRRYRARQWYEVERTYNWEKLIKQEPDPNRNHPDDERKIEEAEKSIGFYKLKTQSDYEPQQHETLTWKYKEIVTLRERLNQTINNFNGKLLKLRSEKKELYELIKQKQKRLSELHAYLPETNRKYLKEIPPLNMNEEWPELNLIEHFQPGCNIEIKDILYLEKKVEDLLPQPPPPKVKASLTIGALLELEKYLTLDIKSVTSFPEALDLIEELQHLPRHNDPLYYDNVTQSPTPWLIEIRYRWLMDLMVEQESIIHTIDTNIRLFNSRLIDLNNERLHTKFEIIFMTSYLITLNQELYILRDSEEIENKLLSNAEEAMKTRNQAQYAINSLNRQIEDIRKNCDRLNEQISSVQSKFMSTTKGHKFFDFLRRIFKKKWRPPKAEKGPDESSESSSEDDSSSEEEGDTKSIDSADVTTIVLDETHCPSGLERPMYELAFKLRSDRHQLERSLAESMQQIENKKEEVKQAQKLMKYHTDIYIQENETLLEFRRKRQQELNKVNVSVRLQMHQIQHFQEGEDFHDLTKVVLFDSTVILRLQGRVDQLKLESLETKRLHRINIVHLRRMNTDIKFMRAEIILLEEKTRQEMMKKFGMVIDLDELEEEVLRKYVFDLETTVDQELRLLELEIAKKKKELARIQEELIAETQKNAEKLNILAVLTEENTLLDKILINQEKNYEKWSKPPNLSIDKDIEKLMVVDRLQKEQIKFLEQEILTLRFKAKPLQIDEVGEADLTEAMLHQEMVPNDDVQACPEIFNADAFETRLVPDDFIMERCQKIVQKVFMLHFGKMTSAENVRRYAYKVTRYLGQAAYSFEGNLNDTIMDCIIENLQNLIPKKYLMLLSRQDLQKMFNEILSLFDYELSDVNTEDVVSGIYDNAKFALTQATGILNKTQFILIHMFKELIEVLPLEEFQSENTVKFIVDNLEKESLFDGRSINIEGLVVAVVEYATANLLDTITAIPIRQLVTNVQKEYSKRKPNNSLGLKCTLGSVHSVSVKSKGKSPSL